MAKWQILKQASRIKINNVKLRGKERKENQIKEKEKTQNGIEPFFSFRI